MPFSTWAPLSQHFLVELRRVREVIRLDSRALVALVVDQLDDMGRRRRSDLRCVLVDADRFTLVCQVEKGMVLRPIVEKSGISVLDRQLLLGLFSAFCC